MFDISYQSKQELMSKRRSEIVKIYANFTVLIFFVLIMKYDEFEVRDEPGNFIWSQEKWTF